MNRSPTPGGMFATNFVGECHVIADRLQCFGRPFAAVGVRFIVPAYTYTPTKWQTEMRVRWCGNVYLIMWKHVIDNVEMCVRWNGNMYLMTWIHVFDNVEMCVRWCECTYLMTWIYIFDNVRIRARWIGPLHLAECSHPISWVSVGISRNVCWYFAECFVCISLVFVGFSRCVRCIIADRQQHFRKPFAAVGVRFIAPAYTYTPTKWQTVMCVWWCGNVYLIMWKHVFDNVDMLERFTINRRIP